MNLFKILLDNGYTQRDKLNVERNWFGCDTYNLDNVYYKGDITIWIGLQWYGMPLPKQKKIGIYTIDKGVNLSEYQKALAYLTIKTLFLKLGVVIFQMKI